MKCPGSIGFSCSCYRASVCWARFGHRPSTGTWASTEPGSAGLKTLLENGLTSAGSLLYWFYQPPREKEKTMAAQTDKAFDLIPTLRAALVQLDDALDNFDESDTEHPAHAFAMADVETAREEVAMVLAEIAEVTK